MAGEEPKPEEWSELAALGESEVPTADELAEARMLAVAAKGKHQVGLSEDAEIGLGLLRVATQGELGREARERLWAEIPLPEGVQRASGGRFTWFSPKWLVFGGLVPAAAAALVVWQNASVDAPLVARFGSDNIPAPNADLLAVQAKWAASDAEREPFERSMNSYRVAVLEGLE